MLPAEFRAKQTNLNLHMLVYVVLTNAEGIDWPQFGLKYLVNDPLMSSTNKTRFNTFKIQYFS